MKEDLSDSIPEFCEGYGDFMRFHFVNGNTKPADISLIPYAPDTCEFVEYILGWGSAIIDYGYGVSIDD